ncbi:hypothetical protein L7F22_021871 [Adiantum nelumboides]|nr:hypothetical protein [Adiantum nelumboides]
MIARGCEAAQEERWRAWRLRSVVKPSDRGGEAVLHAHRIYPSILSRGGEGELAGEEEKVGKHGDESGGEERRGTGKCQGQGLIKQEREAISDAYWVGPEGMNLAKERVYGTVGHGNRRVRWRLWGPRVDGDSRGMEIGQGSVLSVGSRRVQRRVIGHGGQKANPYGVERWSCNVFGTLEIVSDMSLDVEYACSDCRSFDMSHRDNNYFATLVVASGSRKKYPQDGEPVVVIWQGVLVDSILGLSRSFLHLFEHNLVELKSSLLNLKNSGC